MEFYKDFFLITLEMCFAIFIIIFGYAIWNNFDQINYNTAKYYDNTKEVEIYIEDSKNYITLLNNELNSESTKFYLHNISDKNNNTNLLFKIDKNTNIKNNITLKINNNYYFLKDLGCIEDDNYCYYKINNINLKGYETKEYDFKIILDNIDKNINYELVTNI